MSHQPHCCFFEAHHVDARIPILSPLFAFSLIAVFAILQCRFVSLVFEAFFFECLLFLQELKQLADEVRAETIFTVSKTGGHLGSSLGVVELTVALHHVFNCPEDKFLWDVGHQV
jgi:hypothetical protein